MKKSDLYSIFFIFFVTCLIFFKIFTKGLYPVPGDLLVSFYFPWYSGGWEGYNPWTTHKELLAADSIRQIYPWKEFALSQFKDAKIPLWNPYTFAGQPLLANFQSSVFYPLNIFYFILDSRNAWILLIVTQPLLGGLFMYLALRSFMLKPISSLFGAVTFMFSSYLITWMENGNITHSYIWLPASIWSINKLFEKFKFRFCLTLIASLSLSILAGHPQTAIYVYLATVLFWGYKMLEIKDKILQKSLLLIAIIITSFLISAIQILPTASFYKQAPLSLPFSRDVFERSILPFKNLISFFASDFYGHPANNNFWSQSYGDFTPYFGVIPLIFALWFVFLSLREKKEDTMSVSSWRFIFAKPKDKFAKFLTLISLLFILAALRGPITYMIKTLNVPLLDSTTPSRFISISIFFLIILASLGFEDFIKNLKNTNYLKKFLKFLSIVCLIYFSFWLFAFFGKYFLEPDGIWQANLAVTKRNLILPTGMFLSVVALSLFLYKTRIPTKFAIIVSTIGLFSATIVGGVYFSNKFIPTSPKEFIFPNHLLFNWLRENAKLDRFYGQGTAHIDFNFPTYYRVYGAEGYDTLRIERYAQLLASSFSGQIPKSYLRSDGVFPSEENGLRKRLFELLGVKYLIDKEDNPKNDHDWHFERFQNDNLEGFWQSGKFQVYKRTPVLPRIFLTTKYTVINNNQEIITKIYDKDFNLETLILEEEPPIQIADAASGIIIPQVLNYEPNEVKIKSDLPYNSLLFLSDVYDKDWRVFIDNHKTKLLRAHYALRSVAVPHGEHVITFKYLPKSFTQGVYVSSISLILLIVASFYSYRKKIF